MDKNLGTQRHILQDDRTIFLLDLFETEVSLLHPRVTRVGEGRGGKRGKSVLTSEKSWRSTDFRSILSVSYDVPRFLSEVTRDRFKDWESITRIMLLIKIP